MDKLVGIPICIIKNLITEAPIAAILIAVGLFIYYKFSRLLLRKLLGREQVNKMTDLKASDPKTLYDSTLRFAGHAAEFLIVLILFSVACNSVGLLQNFQGTVGACIDASVRR
jgi:hypothetical protein